MDVFGAASTADWEKGPASPSLESMKLQAVTCVPFDVSIVTSLYTYLEPGVHPFMIREAPSPLRLLLYFVLLELYTSIFLRLISNEKAKRLTL